MISIRLCPELSERKIIFDSTECGRATLTLLLVSERERQQCAIKIDKYDETSRQTETHRIALDVST